MLTCFDARSPIRSPAAAAVLPQRFLALPSSTVTGADTMNWRQIVKSLVRLGAVVGTTLPAGFAGRTVAALRDQQSKDRGAAPSPGSGSAASVVSTDTAAGKAGRAGEGEAPGL